jgi:SWI/SNF-related matrix-associated actin-dependent regulator 1 of chromatin subfamily A
MTKLFRFQRKGVYWLKRFDGRALLADEMGLGKSIQALTYMSQTKAFPTLILCPAHLKWHWQSEVTEHLSMISEVLEGRSPPKYRRNLLSHDITIANYDILKAWFRYFKRLRPKLIILDEAQNLTNPNAQRTKLAQRLCKSAPHVIACTGTPLTNRPRDLWPLLNMIRPDKYHNFRKFGDRYCEPELTSWGWQFNGAERLPELRTKLRKRLMIRRKKKQVLTDLPTKRILPTRIALPTTQLKQYREAETDFLHWLRKTHGAHKARRASSAQTLVRLGYLRRLVATLKLSLVTNWIDEFLQQGDGKLLVFGIHKDVLRPLHAHYKPRSVIIDGSVSSKRRKLAEQTFKRRSSVPIFFLQIKAGGTGLNLVESWTSLFAELPWTSADVHQAIDRSHRIGQKHRVESTLLITQETVEEKLYRILRRKQRILDETLDHSKTKTSRKSVFDLLEKEYS